MNWAAQSKKYASSDAGGKFLKLKDDGARAQIVLMDEPAIREQYWSNSERKYYAEPGEGRDRQVSFPVSIFNVTEGRAQVMSLTKGLFSALADEITNEAGGKTDNQVFSVRRSGQGKDTRWQVRHKGTADGDLIEKLETCEIYDVIEEDTTGATRKMDENVDPKRAEMSAKPTSESDDDIPF